MIDRPLRILQVNSQFGGGGIDTQTFELAAGLSELGDDVTIAARRESRWEARVRSMGLAIETFPRSALHIPMVLTLVQAIRRHGIEIVHAHHGRDYWPVVVAARLAGIGTQVVLTRHLMTPPSVLSRLLLLRQADMIAVSGAVEDVLRRVMRGPAARIHRIPCGRDFSRFMTERTEAVWRYRAEQGWPPEAVVFAVVGTFHPPRGKGQLEFLEAASVLHKEFPQARFVILGYGEMKSLLCERIAALGLTGLAQMMDFHYDVETFMSAIDVLVHPTTAGEAFSLVTIEALASARPVIASRKDGIVDCFTHGVHGLLLPPGDVPALTDAMRTMLTNPDLRRRFGAAGSAHVRSAFTRANLARRTRELYVRLCEQ